MSVPLFVISTDPDASMDGQLRGLRYKAWVKRGIFSEVAIWSVDGFINKARSLFGDRSIHSIDGSGAFGDLWCSHRNCERMREIIDMMPDGFHLMVEMPLAGATQSLANLFALVHAKGGHVSWIVTDSGGWWSSELSVLRDVNYVVPSSRLQKAHLKEDCFPAELPSVRLLSDPDDELRVKARNDSRQRWVGRRVFVCGAEATGGDGEWCRIAAWFASAVSSYRKLKDPPADPPVMVFAGLVPSKEMIMDIFTSFGLTSAETNFFTDWTACSRLEHWRSLMAGADVWVAGSTREAYKCMAVESMAFGSVVIGSEECVPSVGVCDCFHEQRIMAGFRGLQTVQVDEASAVRVILGKMKAKTVGSNRQLQWARHGDMSCDAGWTDLGKALKGGLNG